MRLWCLVFAALMTLPPIRSEEAEVLLKQSSNITIHAGKDTTIKCDADTAASVACIWLWEYPDRNGAPTVVAGFPGHGPTSTDCSINLVNVSQIQTGWWTCRAKAANATILHTRPVFLQVFKSPDITFEVVPVNRTFSVGSKQTLNCMTSIDVQTCRWKFQQQGQAEALVVSEGVPHAHRDCSITLENIRYEQAGAWTCGTRADPSDTFTYTDTAYIGVEHKEEAFPVEFVEEPEDTIVALGEDKQLNCKVHEEAHIEDCRWYWQPIGHSNAWKVLIREFLPVNNDCSIHFTNITADPDGLWTCHVKPIHSKKFKASRTAKLTVKGEIDVSTLTREISVSEGEMLHIFCKAEEPAKACKWKRKPFETEVSDSNLWVFSDTFQPPGNDSFDCSLHIAHTLFNHQGLWVCSIQLADDQPFLETMPIAVTVKAPSTVKFVEPARTQLAAENQSIRLNCSTLSTVHQCQWTWYEVESKVTEKVMKYNFTTSEHNHYDCSVVIPKVERSMQGVWQCGVKYGDPSNRTTSFARPFSLTVVKTGPITFREVSEKVYVVDGFTSVLPCVTKEPVEECLWVRQTNLTSPSHQASHFLPSDFNNCSIQVTGEPSDSWWTCSARNPGESNFTSAPPTRVVTIYPGNVSTRSMISSDDNLVLACQMSPAVPSMSCDWIHPSAYNIFEFNNTENYKVEFDLESGICSVSFQPMLVDVGHWKCVFHVTNNNYILGEASFTVLTSPQNVRLSWIVGVLATVSLMLTILLFIVITCRCYQCRRSTKANVAISKSQPESMKRYSEDPTKGINFSFTESPEVLVDFSLPPQDNHHYERVGRFMGHRPNFYQNVD